MTSVILTTPLLLALYGIALVLSLIDLFHRASGYVFSLLSAGVFVAASVVAVLSAASLFEIGGAALVFLVVNLIAVQGRKRK